MIDKLPAPTEGVDPRYDLSSAELEALETSLVNEIREKTGDEEDLYAVWIASDNEYSNIIRTHESHYWPTMDEIMEPHEVRSLFLALVDIRNGRDEVVHGFRVSGSFTHGRSGEQPVEVGESTGLVLIDDIVNSGQNLSAEEFRRYYTERGFDTQQFISVETNFKKPNLQEKVARYNGLPATQVGYLALFQLCDQKGLRANETAIFASLNEDATSSLDLLGAEYEPLVGRSDLMTPIEDGKFDPDYRPVAIPSTPKNLELFREITAFAAPTITLE